MEAKRGFYDSHSITAAHLNDLDYFCFTLLLRRTDVRLLVIARCKVTVVKPDLIGSGPQYVLFQAYSESWHLLNLFPHSNLQSARLAD